MHLELQEEDKVFVLRLHALVGLCVSKRVDACMRMPANWGHLLQEHLIVSQESEEKQTLGQTNALWYNQNSECVDTALPAVLLQETAPSWPTDNPRTIKPESKKKNLMLNSILLTSIDFTIFHVPCFSSGIKSSYVFGELTFEIK